MTLVACDFTINFSGPAMPNIAAYCRTLERAKELQQEFVKVFRESSAEELGVIAFEDDHGYHLVLGVPMYCTCYISQVSKSVQVNRAQKEHVEALENKRLGFRSND